MILNPMYRKKADNGQLYCVLLEGYKDGQYDDPTDMHLVFFDGKMLDILMFKETFDKKLPPYNNLTVADFMLETNVNMKVNGELATCVFSIHPLDDTTMALELKYSDGKPYISGYDPYGSYRTVLQNGQINCSISNEPMDDVEMTHIRITAPFEDLMENAGISAGILFQLLDEPTSLPSRVQSLMLRIKVA